MRIACFSLCDYERPYLIAANTSYQFQLDFHREHLNEKTAIFAQGADAVCCFVNDCLNADVLKQLAEQGCRLVALRCAGYNHVDLTAAKQYNITVTRVPAYSPYAVAEHAVGLILALNRHINRAYNRVREHDFSLHGLMGFDIHGKTIGVFGTGHIGSIFAKIMHGFSANVIACDLTPNPELQALGIKYVDLDTLYHESHIISLHCPLTPETHHLINADAIAKMRQDVMLINTSRGAIVDAKALIAGLKSQKIGYLGLDVYEEEGDLFFSDLSDQVISDDVFARLLTFPNVIITGHQAFFTREAIENIAKVTFQNIDDYANNRVCSNNLT